MCNQTLIAHILRSTQTPQRLWQTSASNSVYFQSPLSALRPLVKRDKRASVRENNLSPFFMSISISVGAPLEWNFVNGAHSFHSSASRGNRAGNSAALPLWVTAVMYPIGGRPMSDFTVWHLNTSQTEPNSPLLVLLLRHLVGFCDVKCILSVVDKGLKTALYNNRPH